MRRAPLWRRTTHGPSRLRLCPAPTVTAVTPANASTGVAITSAVTATFSQAMNSATITGSTFTLTPQGGTAVSAVVSYASQRCNTDAEHPAGLQHATTRRQSPLECKARRRAALAANYTWTFTTAAAPPAPHCDRCDSSECRNGRRDRNRDFRDIQSGDELGEPERSTFTLTGPAEHVCRARCLQLGDADSDFRSGRQPCL